MRNFWRKTVSLLAFRQTNILGAALVIMITVALSRILGLWRDRMLTSRFTVDELGVYFAAFRLPNMLFELLVMGTLSTAFIPVFNGLVTREKEKEAFKMASSVINIGLLVFGFLTLPVLIWTEKFSRLLAPGFSSGQLKLMADFTRIMLVVQVFPLILGNFSTGILQSYRRFLLPSLAPVVYNLGIITGILFLTPYFGLYGAVWGVVLGAVLFMAIQIPLVFKLGFRYFFSFELKDPNVRKVGKLMLPRTLGLAVSQIDTTIDLVLSSFLGARAISVFNFAQHLQQFPVGLFGATIAQAVLPALSEEKARENPEDFKTIFLSSFHQILFLILPASAILIVLRIPLVRLVFGASRFDWQATVLTGETLAFFSLSLFAQSTIHLLARAFFALYDSRTPVVIGIISVAVNVFLSIYFLRILHLPVWGLAFSASLSSILNAVLLLVFLDKKVNKFARIRLFLPAIKMFIASFIAGISLYIPLKLLDQLVFDTTRTINLLMLTGIAASIGLSVYLFFTWFLEVKEALAFLEIVKKLKKFRQFIFAPPYTS